jgi:TolB protein
MDSYPFGHTSPIWINSKGSTESSTRKTANRELRIALNQIEARARLAYQGDDITNLLARIDLARAALRE